MAGLAGAQLYMSLCGTEVWNRSRLQAYMDGGVTPAGARLLGGCDALADVIPAEGHRPPDDPGYYRLPELDPAPWYDPTVPESRNFAGLMVTELSLSKPVSRRLIQNIGHGGVMGRVRHPARVLEVRATLVGKTCCAAEYGLRWLTEALLGRSHTGRGAGCDSCDASFLTCCPRLEGEDDCITVGGQTYVRQGGPGSEYQLASSLVRSLHGVGLTDGPDVVRCHGLGCGCGCSALTEVEFSLGVENPWLYHAPVEQRAEPVGSCFGISCTVQFSKSQQCVDDLNCVGGQCDDDPLYPRPPDPPRVWTPVVDGVCVALSSNQLFFSINDGDDRTWFDAAPVVTVTAGPDGLRGLVFRFYPNPTGAECEPRLETAEWCEAVGSIFVKYVPPDSVLTVDGERRAVTLECPGAEPVDGSSQVASADGGAFEWFDLGRDPYCVTVDKDCFHSDFDSSFVVSTVVKEL